MFPSYRIKKNFWPQIPNPGESTIGNWSPDYPLKVRTSEELTDDITQIISINTYRVQARLLNHEGVNTTISVALFKTEVA